MTFIHTKFAIVCYPTRAFQLFFSFVFCLTGISQKEVPFRILFIQMEEKKFMIFLRKKNHALKFWLKIETVKKKANAIRWKAREIRKKKE